MSVIEFPTGRRGFDPRMEKLFSPSGAPHVSRAGACLLREVEALQGRGDECRDDLATAVEHGDVQACAIAIRKLLGISLFLREYANLAEILRT